ncbi:MAG: Omp28-related outer membrane protein [Bacteroidetes bacterium]|nr:Omp28-related outer membrane protein [Bacteroidota bacterium]
MKRFFTLSVVILFSVTYLFAQNIVGTDPENKNVILEEFTGIHCTYCPSGHQIAQGIQNANPDVVLINIHTGSYAVPSGGEPDFRTPWGDAIAAQSGLTGYPAGTVNRHLFPGMSQGSGTAMSRGNWVAASNQTMAAASYANVGVESYIDVETRVLTVNVEIYYTDDSPESSNFLNVAILQDSILGPQTGGGAGNNYNHMHMLRHLVTGQWGLEITSTTTGTLYQNTLTYTIPDDYNDVEVVLEHLEIVSYLSQTTQEVISGSRGTVTLSGGPDPLTAEFVAEATEFCYSGTAHFASTSTGDPIQYQWTFEGGNPPTSQLMNPNVYYAAIGDYDVTLIVTDALGNKDTTTNVDYIQILDCVGVDEEASKIALSVFPNPSHGVVKLNIEADLFNAVELRVIDIMGKVVYEQSNISVVGSFNTEIDLTGYSDGIYFITVSGDDKQVSKKIFLQK